MREGGKIKVRDLLEVGAHFGHQSSKWNPKMKPYIFGERNGVHIINLQKTAELFEKAYDFVKDVVARGGKILLVGTKKQSQEVVKSTAKEVEMYYVVERWLGGTLTNFRTIRQGIEKYNELVELISSGRINVYPKKEAMKIRRRVEKMAKYYEGIKDMKKLPDAVFVIDIKRELTCVREAKKMEVPIVAVVDTNCDPEFVDYPIPGNDDAIRAIKFYVQKVGEAIREGISLYEAYLAQMAKVEGGEVV